MTKMQHNEATQLGIDAKVAIVAHHEAGHAVIAAVRKLPLQSEGIMVGCERMALRAAARSHGILTHRERARSPQGSLGLMRRSHSAGSEGTLAELLLDYLERGLEGGTRNRNEAVGPVPRRSGHQCCA